MSERCLVPTLAIILISFLAMPVFAESYRCRWGTKWYTCDYIFSGKYMTVYRSDGKEFNFYTDAVDEHITNWYETTGKRREGQFSSVVLNNGRNAIQMFFNNGKNFAILEIP